MLKNYKKMTKSLKSKRQKVKPLTKKNNAEFWGYKEKDVQEAVNDYKEFLNFKYGKIMFAIYQDKLNKYFADKYLIDIWNDNDFEIYEKIFGNWEVK